MSNVKGPDDAQNPHFEELVAQYQGSVLRMCFLYLCDKTLAEDAVQETFVKVYRGIEWFSRPEQHQDLDHENCDSYLLRYESFRMVPAF